MSTNIVYISEGRVLELLQWNLTFDVVKEALLSVTNRKAIQNARQITKVGDGNSLLYSMPGYFKDEKFGALACKLVTDFPKNLNLASVMANIIYMDDKTGELKAVIGGTEITSWRTAAASAVATKYIKGPKCSKSNKLAILGAGTQGKYHALAFRHLFEFGEIRVWNRTLRKAQDLVEELNSLEELGAEKLFMACESAQECVKDADVIVTATSAQELVVKYEWLKNGVHINAVGVGPNLELDHNTYKASCVFIDYWDGAKSELRNLQELGVNFKGQIGDVIADLLPVPNLEEFTIFQSLGMAVEDCAMARMIYDLHIST